MSKRIWLAVVIGIAIGVAGAEMLPKAGKPPAFMVVEYGITDQGACQAYVKGANALPTSRVFLARHAKGTALAGEVPKWIGILKYPSLEDALAFERSPEYQALVPIRDKRTKWRAYVVEGLPAQ